MKQTNERIAIDVSVKTITVNVVLTIFKLIAGILANSAAMLSDAVHTLSDVLSTFVVIIGVKLAGRDSDRDHPYGHERFECVAAIVLSALLFATGLGIGWSGIQAIAAGTSGDLAIPGTLALVAALASIAVKEAMYWYTRAAAKKTDSAALMADAWHHRSDALSSIGSFVGILGARLGLPILDPAACVVICVFILKAAVDIFSDAVGRMTDKSCGEALDAEIRGVVSLQPGVKGIDLLNTRMFGSKLYMDIEISADGKLPLNDTHNIAHSVHDAIESHFPKVKHCMVHVNPAEE